MTMVIRPANLATDGDALLKFLQENLSAAIDRRRFDWLYRDCPSGEGKAWLAIEEKTDRVIGAAAVFPRKMNLAGQIQEGCVFGDFCISPDHRSLGPALQLQRKCIDSVADGPFRAGYDLPSTSMLAIYQRLGIKTTGKLVRMTKLLRSNAKVAAKVKPRFLAGGLSAAANVVLSARRGSLKLKSGVSIEVHKGGFGSEFTELAARTKGYLGISAERSAEFLTWRYTEHPQNQYETLTARRGANLQGYLVCTQQGSSTHVADCIGESAKVRGDLLRGLMTFVKTRKAESINVPVLESHAFCAELRDMGFSARESVPAVFLQSKGEAAPATGWFLLDGDRES